MAFGCDDGLLSENEQLRYPDLAAGYDGSDRKSTVGSVEDLCPMGWRTHEGVVDRFDCAATPYVFAQDLPPENLVRKVAIVKHASSLRHPLGVTARHHQELLVG